jgi:hypothetical protein
VSPLSGQIVAYHVSLSVGLSAAWFYNMPVGSRVAGNGYGVAGICRFQAIIMVVGELPTG